MPKVLRGVQTSTQRLLQDLGMKTPLQSKTIPLSREEDALYWKFARLNQTRLTAEINRELQEMLELRDEAMAQARIFLANNNLSVSSKPEVRWNPHFLCLEIGLKINDRHRPKMQRQASTAFQYQGKAYANPEPIDYHGRDINIRIMPSKSNNNFNAMDLKSMFDACIAAARRLDANIEEPGGFRERLILLMNDFQTGDKKIEDIIQENIQLQADLVVELAVALASDKTNREEIKQKRKEIEEELINYIADRPRPIDIVAYKQAVNDPNQSQWLMATNIPYSDIPSDQRTFIELEISNDWHFIHNVTKFEYGEEVQTPAITTTKIREGNRSSSAVSLEQVSTEDYDRKKLQELSALKALIRKAARLKIIEMIRRGEDINFDEVFLVKTAYISLLTPLASLEFAKEHEGLLPPGKLRDTLLKGNEQEQMIALQTALNTLCIKTQFTRARLKNDKLAMIALLQSALRLTQVSNTRKISILQEAIDSLKSKKSENESGLSLLKHRVEHRIRKSTRHRNRAAKLDAAQALLDDEQINFEKEDIDEIIAGCRGTPSARILTHENLLGIKIKHQFFYSNFIVNTFKKEDLGKISAHTSGYNKSYNEDGISELNDIIKEFLRDKYQYLFADCTKPWSEFGLTLKRYHYRINPKFDEENAKIHRILSLYMRLRDYFEEEKQRKYSVVNSTDSIFSAKKKRNSRIVESYFAAAIESALAIELGFEIRTNCKSGKDRTGLFLAILEASAGPPEKFAVNLCNALKYSDIKDLIEKNRPGCRGVQIDPDVMDGLVTYFSEALGKDVALDKPEQSFRQLIEMWKSRDVGSMPRKIFNNEAALDRYFQKIAASGRNSLERRPSPRAWEARRHIPTRTPSTPIFADTPKVSVPLPDPSAPGFVKNMAARLNKDGFTPAPTPSKQNSPNRKI